MNGYDYNDPTIEISQEEYKRLLTQKYWLLTENLYRNAHLLKLTDGRLIMTIDNTEEILKTVDYDRFMARYNDLVASYKAEHGEEDE